MALRAPIAPLAPTVTRARAVMATRHAGVTIRVRSVPTVPVDQAARVDQAAAVVPPAAAGPTGMVAPLPVVGPTAVVAPTVRVPLAPAAAGTRAAPRGMNSSTRIH